MIHIKRYISDVIDLTRIQPHQINLISSGCCTGKTTFVLEDIVGNWPGVTARDMIVVTSRSITATQMDYEHDAVSQYYTGSNLACYWDEEYDGAAQVMCMTYDKMIHLVRMNRAETKNVLENVKVVVFDEIHTLFIDDFIQGVREVRAWLRGVLPTRDDLLIIGMTATPNVIYRINSNTANLKIVPILDEVMIQHKAKNIICTDFAGAVDLLSSKKLPGRNIYMGKKIEECAVLAEVIEDSGVIVSKSNYQRNTFAARFNPFELDYSVEMDYLRDYVCKNRDIPATCSYKGRRRELNTLIATSTLREGFSLDRCSGVRNVFVSAVDEMSIIQFLGRCRYDVDNLVIVAPVSKFRHIDDYGYFDDAERMFGAYLAIDDSAWFETIKAVSYRGKDSVQMYGDILGTGSSLASYNEIKNNVRLKLMVDNNEWVFSGAGGEVEFWNTAASKESGPTKDLISLAKKYRVFPGTKSRDYSLTRIMNKLSSIGYRVTTKKDRAVCYQVWRE